VLSSITSTLMGQMLQRPFRPLSRAWHVGKRRHDANMTRLLNKGPVIGAQTACFYDGVA